ncbi:MAG: sugar phosphate isomerase/epimerase family protein [Maioricimonas sp. JB045]|uniref:sugar phosphate isomerase/epimerase family protein n=1 Tax=Maioricimonas sp. JC845 TaxID=3232138 RepID=UPI003457FE29
MSRTTNRRQFLRKMTGYAAGAALGAWAAHELHAAKESPLYRISLAEWSLHKAIFDKKLDHLDFAKVAQEEFGIDGVEYVNQFFFEKAKDKEYLGEMKKRADDHGVKSLLIMIDREGRLGDPDEAKRTQAIENHYKWVEAAAFLGCHSIRVNAASAGSYDEQVALAADGLRRLTEFAEKHQLYVIVENHGGLSSNGAWLAEVMRRVDHPHCGTLPDFGNFGINRQKDIWYDRYRGVEELMPYAQAVSAKTYSFDEDRPFVTIDRRHNQETDYLRMMKIVVDSGYRGYVGIEYEGHELDEMTGIRKSKELLERVREKLSA